MVRLSDADGIWMCNDALAGLYPGSSRSHRPTYWYDGGYMILMRQDSGGWRPTSLTNFANEAELQGLLQRSPELIPGCAGNATVAELRVPGTGQIDLICIDANGTLTLVECKLAANRQIRREIVGQVLAYASGLEGMTYADFAERFVDRENRSLVAAVGGFSEQVDETAFQNALSQTLSLGRFRLVLAVDEITPELKSIVEYLNRHLSDTLSLLALELGYLRIDRTEILVPATYGAEIAEPKIATKKPWTETDITEALEALPPGPPIVLVEQLLEHARRSAATMKGGVGIAPSAGFYYPIGTRRPSIFSLYVKDTGPVIAINLGSIAGASMSRAEQVLQCLQTSPSLAAVTGDGVEALSKYPSFDLVDLHAKDPAAPGLLLSAVGLAASNGDDAGNDHHDLPGNVN